MDEQRRVGSLSFLGASSLCVWLCPSEATVARMAGIIVLASFVGGGGDVNTFAHDLVKSYNTLLTLKGYRCVSKFRVCGATWGLDLRGRSTQTPREGSKQIRNYSMGCRTIRRAFGESGYASSPFRP